ncbi:uncharacterized protein LY79DRAFT_266320, partial [Colletotrichum navitas]
EGSTLSNRFKQQLLKRPVQRPRHQVLDGLRHTVLEVSGSTRIRPLNGSKTSAKRRTRRAGVTTTGARQRLTARRSRRRVFQSATTKTRGRFRHRDSSYMSSGPVGRIPMGSLTMKRGSLILVGASLRGGDLALNPPSIGRGKIRINAASSCSRCLCANRALKMQRRHRGESSRPLSPMDYRFEGIGQVIGKRPPYHQVQAYKTLLLFHRPESYIVKGWVGWQ